MSKFHAAIDAEADITGLLGDECFLCGHPIVFTNDFGRWGLDGELSVLLPCHISCLNGRTDAEVRAEYHRRVHDLANVKRAN